MQLALTRPRFLDRYPALPTAAYWVVTVIGAVWCFLIVYGVVGYGLCGNTGTVPCDAYSYWAVDGTPYTWETNLEYRYSPAFLWIIAPFQALPFEVFLGVWTAAHVAALIWLRAGWFLIVPGLNDDVLRGNISTFIALFAVLAIQRSAAWWAPVLLTKITPAVGMVWHLVRREWRELAIAFGVTAGIVAVGLTSEPRTVASLDRHSPQCECDVRTRPSTWSAAGATGARCARHRRRSVDGACLARAHRHAHCRPGALGIQPGPACGRPSAYPTAVGLGMREARWRSALRSYWPTLGVSWLTMVALILLTANEAAVPLDFLIRPMAVALIPAAIIALAATPLGRARLPVTVALSSVVLLPALWPLPLGILLIEIGIWLFQRISGRGRFGVGRFAALAVGVLAIVGAVRLTPQLTDYIAEASGSEPADGRPVYLLLLDGYPRADSLRELGIDNSSFIAELESRAFEHYPEAISAHQWTHRTLQAMVAGDPTGIPDEPGTSGEEQSLRAALQLPRGWLAIDPPASHVVMRGGH